jgi:hypothetical protein
LPLPDGRYIVEAFVSTRQMAGRRQYLVKWSGFSLVGEEAAYTWEWAASLQQDLRRQVYRALVRRLRGQPPGAGASADSTPEGWVGQQGSVVPWQAMGAAAAVTAGSTNPSQ